MKTKRTFDLSYYVNQVLKTRRFGHTYVHVGAANEFTHEDIQFVVESFGRSIHVGGHRLKVYARRDGKPVPTVELLALVK